MKVEVYRFERNRPALVARLRVRDHAEALRVRDAWEREEPGEYQVYEIVDRATLIREPEVHPSWIGHCLLILKACVDAAR